MKKIFRTKNNKDYWVNRWGSSKINKTTFHNEQIHPNKYAEIIAQEGKSILATDCGSERVSFHYWNEGKNIHGIDVSKTAIEGILAFDLSAKVQYGTYLMKMKDLTRS